VLASTDENLRLGGVERDCTVLFSDLRGFTTFSESQPAARVIEVVNIYLNEMTERSWPPGGRSSRTWGRDQWRSSERRSSRRTTPTERSSPRADRKMAGADGVLDGHDGRRRRAGN